MSSSTSAPAVIRLVLPRVSRVRVLDAASHTVSPVSPVSFGGARATIAVGAPIVAARTAGPAPAPLAAASTPRVTLAGVVAPQPALPVAAVPTPAATPRPAVTSRPTGLTPRPAPAASREHEQLAKGLGEALTAVRGQALTELRGLEGRVVQLAIALAERIVGCEVEAGRYRLEERIEDTLRHVRDAAEAVVRLHPADVEALGASSGFRRVADPALRRGDVVVETPAGRIVRSITEQIEAVRATALDAFEGERPATGALAA